MRTYVYSNLVRIDKDNPRPIAFCDLTGFMCMRDDLVPQMQYVGQGLQWQGFLVHKKFAFKPSPWLSPIILPPDPTPVENPRPGLGQDAPLPTLQALPWPLQIELLNRMGLDDAPVNNGEVIAPKVIAKKVLEEEIEDQAIWG